jgi:hypothetical protein
MIKIKIPKADLDVLLKEHFKYFTDKGPQNKGRQRNMSYEGLLLEKSLSSTGEAQLLFQLLYRKRKKILVGNPYVLSRIIDEITHAGFSQTTMDNISNPKSTLHQEICEVFNYDSFIGRSASGWGAYRLTQKLHVEVCPYCNRQFISTYYHKGGKTRPALDHFWSKTKYPYLSVSFYNLIPCCTTCNSSFKGQIDFSLDSHLHPYVEGFGRRMKFRTGIILRRDARGGIISTDVDTLVGKNSNFKVELKYMKGSQRFKTLAEENIKVFKLEALYGNHIDYINELVQKAQIYSNSYIEDLFRNYRPLFYSRQDVIRMLLGAYVEEEEQGKRVLSKFIADIAEELRLFESVDR